MCLAKILPKPRAAAYDLLKFGYRVYATIYRNDFACFTINSSC